MRVLLFALLAGTFALCASIAPAIAQPPQPALTPPRLLDSPELELAPGTEPLPEDAAVELQITIAADGTVSDAQIVTALREDIDPLVLDAARRMRFEPARRDGVAIPATIRFRFRVRVPAPEPLPVEPPPEGATTGGGAPIEPGATPVPAPTAPPDLEPPPPEASFGATAVVERPEPGAATRIVLEAEELTTVPGTFGEPLRVVATLPGVARTPFGLGYFVVRGASFENTGFLIDGYWVPILYHLGAGPAVISSRLVERLRFYPGGYPVEQGRFIAGLIALDTAPPPANTLHLEAEVDLLRASALAILPFDEGRGSVALALRRSYYDLVLPLIIDGIDLAYTDWQIRGDYRLTDRLSASLFVFGSYDLLDTTLATGAGVTAGSTNTSFEYAFTRAIASLQLKLPDEIRVTWSGSVGEDTTAIGSRQPGVPNLSLELTRLSVGTRLHAIVPMSDALQSSAGVDVDASIYRAHSQLPSFPSLGDFPEPDFNPTVTEVEAQVIIQQIGTWLEQVVRPGPFELTAGLRMEYLRYADVATAQFDPRGVARWKTHERVTLVGATGLFTQPPNPMNIERQVGNPEMRPQRSWQSSLGVELTLPYDVEATTTGFYNRMWHLQRTTNQIIREDDGSTRRLLYLDDGEGRSYGLEVMLRRKIERGLYGWLSYTLAWSDRFLEGGDTVPFFFDQRHTLNLALSYATANGWRFGARFTLASGRPTRAVTGALYDGDGDFYDAQRTGLTERLPTYHQLDVRIDREITIGPLEGSIYLDVLNAYYAQNAEGKLYQYDFRRSAPLPGLPTLGTIGIRLEYE